jgi:hypothetical protein
MLQNVRSEMSGPLFHEAVLCYNAGAYRAAVVSAWNACIVDIIDKLQELEISGDEAAKILVDRLKKAIKSNNIKALQKLEFELLEKARDPFELISSQEKIDLERLQRDRHRCAHPALQTPKTPYQPSPELVRMHLRCLAEALLMHEPVQGRAALERVLSEVESNYFPTDVERARTVLSSGPLVAPRRALLRNTIMVILKVILRITTDIPINKWKRFKTALMAIREMHPKGYTDAMNECYGRLTKELNDEQLLFFLYLSIREPNTLEYAHESALAKMGSCFSRMSLEYPPNAIAFVEAYSVDDMRPDVVARLRTLDSGDMEQIVTARPDMAAGIPQLRERAIELFESAASYEQANAIIDNVMNHILTELSEEQLSAVLRTILDNSEYHKAYSTSAFLERIDNETDVDLESYRKDFEERGIEHLLSPKSDSDATADASYPDVPF